MSGGCTFTGEAKFYSVIYSTRSLTLDRRLRTPERKDIQLTVYMYMRIK